MTYLYLTHEQLQEPTGCSLVATQEARALKEMAERDGVPFVLWDQSILGEPDKNYFGRDEQVFRLLAQDDRPYRLAHAGPGLFANSLQELKRRGCRVSTTAICRDLAVSKREHDRLNHPQDIRCELSTVQEQCLRAAVATVDAIVCPSELSAREARSYGWSNIHVIPHGVDVPDSIEQRCSSPGIFHVGYLGMNGPDKGFLYLLEAWHCLAYPAGTAVLSLAGHKTLSAYVGTLIRHTLGGSRMEKLPDGCMEVTRLDGRASILLLGSFVDPSKFYRELDLYVQPAATEAFGLPVLEALACGRSAICSQGAGVAELLPESWTFPACDVVAMAKKIEDFRNRNLAELGRAGRELAKGHSWAKARRQYQDLWRRLLA